MHHIASLSPQAAHDKLSNGATLIDIRSSDEYARKHIKGAISSPLDKLTTQSIDSMTNGGVVIFSCLSGMRTKQNTPFLQECAANCQAVYVLDGGLNAWQKAKLPIVQHSTPPEIMRQVQMIAGTLILLGVVLGASVSPWFYGLSGFVGVGLLFAGLTGFCGMAKLLAFMPWNRI